ncbi:MAG: hypothetical protein WHT06_06840 [Desulfobacterales bacterium]
MSPAATERRIRRQVVARPHRFFAVTAPGLETLAAAEAQAAGLPPPRVLAGGFEAAGRLPELYRANLVLSTATRILVRLVALHATRFADLERKAASFPWELYLAPGCDPGFSVAVHRCRLHHRGAIAERLQAAIRSRLGPAPAAGGGENRPRIWVRGEEDRFLLSLDASGEPLHRRGLRRGGAGKAPLRATLAAAALRLVGFTGEEVLLDPMCGGGTLPLEAAFLAKKIPPGWFRRFAFFDWPAFRPPAWEHLRRQASRGFRTLEAPRIFASDRDPEACRLLAESLEAGGMGDAVEVACRDFFALDPAEVSAAPGILVLNPPYGRRLGGGAQARDLLRAVVARLRERYAGWRVALFAPRAWAAEIDPLGLVRHDVVHGGLKVGIFYGAVCGKGGRLQAKAVPQS